VHRLICRSMREYRVLFPREPERAAALARAPPFFAVRHVSPRQLPRRKNSSMTRSHAAGFLIGGRIDGNHHFRNRVFLCAR